MRAFGQMLRMPSSLPLSNPNIWGFKISVQASNLWPCEESPPHRPWPWGLRTVRYKGLPLHPPPQKTHALLITESVLRHPARGCASTHWLASSSQKAERLSCLCPLDGLMSSSGLSRENFPTHLTELSNHSPSRPCVHRLPLNIFLLVSKSPEAWYPKHDTLLQVSPGSYRVWLAYFTLLSGHYTMRPQRTDRYHLLSITMS